MFAHILPRGAAYRLIVFIDDLHLLFWLLDGIRSEHIRPARCRQKWSLSRKLPAVYSKESSTSRMHAYTRDDSILHKYGAEDARQGVRCDRTRPNSMRSNNLTKAACRTAANHMLSYVVCYFSHSVSTCHDQPACPKTDLFSVYFLLVVVDASLFTPEPQGSS